MSFGSAAARRTAGLTALAAEIVRSVEGCRILLRTPSPPVRNPCGIIRARRGSRPSIVM
ncbi:hypothetical protein BH10ACT5_BH10ACT5_09900 [soil metagenome]